MSYGSSQPVALPEPFPWFPGSVAWGLFAFAKAVFVFMSPFVQTQTGSWALLLLVCTVCTILLDLPHSCIPLLEGRVFILFVLHSHSLMWRGHSLFIERDWGELRSREVGGSSESHGAGSEDAKSQPEYCLLECAASRGDLTCSFINRTRKEVYLKEEEGQRNLPSTGSLKWLARPKAGARSLVKVSHVCAGTQTLGTISRKQDWRWSGWGLNCHAAVPVSEGRHFSGRLFEVIIGQVYYIEMLIVTNIFMLVIIYSEKKLKLSSVKSCF